MPFLYLFSKEQIINIAELCRKKSINHNYYYRWSYYLILLCIGNGFLLQHTKRKIPTYQNVVNGKLYYHEPLI